MGACRACFYRDCDCCVRPVVVVSSFSSDYWSSCFDVVVPCPLVSHLHSRRRHRTCLQILNNLFLTIERGNPSKRQDQTIHRIMVHPGLLKCGKVEMESTIDQGNLIKILGIHWESWPSSWRTSSRKDSAFCKERRDYSRQNGDTRFRECPRKG